MTCALPLHGDAVYVPGVGFRSADVLIARVPVTREHAGRTITVERAASSPDGTEVVLTHSGISDWDPRQMAPWANEPVSLRTRDGRTYGPKGHRGGIGRHAPRHDRRIEIVRRELTLEALPAGAMSADLLVGDAVVPLELEPSSVGGVPAHALDVTVRGNDVSVRAVRVAHATDEIAVELGLSALGDERRAVRAIGASPWGGPHRHDPPVLMRDEIGGTHEEHQVLRVPG